MQEVLPPEPAGMVPSSTWQKYKPALVVSSFSIVGTGLVAWGFNQFLQARGFISVVGSRFFLGVACLGAVSIAFGVTRLLRRRNTWFVGALILIVLAALLLDSLIPMPQLSQLASSLSHVRPSDWRTIKDWQKAELAAVLDHYPNYTLHLVASSVTDEPLDYASQFKEFFTAHKWKVVGPETAPPEGVPVLNMQLSISEEYWGKQRPEAFTALDGTLQFVGLKRAPNFIVDPLVAKDEVVMWIGPETPPGFPQHVPLQLFMLCEHSLKFTDDTMHFIGDSKDFVRWVRIKPPANSQFVNGQRLLVLLTGIAKSVATSEHYTVEALGHVMPRPDALDVTVTKERKADEALEVKIISDEELRVKCVVDRSSK